MVDITEVELSLETTRASRSWRVPILPDPFSSSLAEGEHGEGERSVSSGNDTIAPLEVESIIAD